MLGFTEEQVRQRIYEERTQYYDENPDQLDWKVRKIMEDFPCELEQNIIEWIHHEPITEIMVGNLSIPLLLEEWNRTIFLNDDVSEAVDQIKMYKRRGYLYENEAIHAYEPFMHLCGFHLTRYENWEERFGIRPIEEEKCHRFDEIKDKIYKKMCLLGNKIRRAFSKNPE